MQAHFSSLHTASSPGVGSKGQNIFLKVVILHFNLKGWRVEHNACTYFVLTHTLGPYGRDNRSKLFFSECGYVAYQIKGKEV